ncbi:GAF domain-containing protein [Haloferax larsenii]|uniref:GAF domain-containing protein n=1 Tax=Haloferax larsenii TaxID=302484 RepID=A0ABY5RJS3_HALLR|nr:GAF domain-containing protein [Haloferax larsenii]UVE51810.1 GAF domain-containing protein [Haloferax larsenii]
MLCVSDDSEFVQTLESSLGTRTEDLSVCHATDTETARTEFDASQDEIYCVVLTTPLASGGGLQLLREIRRIDRGIPVIVASDDQDRVSDAIDTGATDYIYRTDDPETMAWLGFRVEQAIADYRVERSNRTRLTQQQVVSQVGTLALTTLDLHGVFELLVSRVGEVLGAESVLVLEHVEEQQQFSVAAASEGETEEAKTATESVETVLDDTEGTLVSETFRRGRSVVVDSFASDERFDPVEDVVPRGVESGMSVPIGVDADRWGVLCVHATAPGQFSDDDIHFLENIAAIVGAAIDRHELKNVLTEVLDRVGEGVIAFDTDWRLTYVNARAKDVMDEPTIDLIGRPLRDLVPESSSFQPEFEAAMRTQEPREFEAYSENTETWYAVRAYPSETGLSVYFTVITEQRERKAKVEQYARMLETVGDAVYALDDDGRFTAVNPAFERLTGLESDAVIGVSASQLADELGLTEREATGFASSSGETVEFELPAQNGSTVRVEDHRTPLVVDGTAIGSVGVLRDVTARYRYERLLATLHERTREMMTAPDRGAVLEAAVRACDEVLGDARTELFVFDDEQTRLTRVGEAGTGLGDKPLGDGINQGGVWDAFVDGDVRVVEVAPDGGVVDGVERVIAAPLGRHGILVTGHQGTVAPTDVDVELVSLLTATVEELLERIRAEEKLRERDQRLAEQNETLRELDQINTTIRNVNQSLIKAPTRRDALAAVGEHLAGADQYAVVWHLEPHEVGDEFEPQPDAVHSADTAYADRLGEIANVEPLSGLLERAIETKSMQRVDDVLDDDAWGSHRGDALTYGFRSLAVIPAVADERVEALFVVHGATTDAFVDSDRLLLEELGDTVAHAVASTGRAGAMLADRRVEVEVKLGSDRLSLTRLANRIDSEVTLTGLLPQSDGSLVAFVTADADHGGMVAAGTNVATNVRLLSADEDGGLFELRLPREALFETLYASEAELRELRSDGTQTTVTVDVPERIHVRSFVEAIATDYPGTTLLSRRTKTKQAESPATFTTMMRDEWTDRQYEAIRAAYLAGFYEWPRQSTAEGLAEALDISAPTFQYHLRAAERKLVDELFD